MSYTDVLLTYDSAGGYGGVHCKQKYDAIATALAAHASWSLVDTVDFVSAPNTIRSYVWKCAAAGSGLPADFFVVFTLSFTTATNVWAVTGTFGSPQISLGEGYNSTTKVFSKYSTVTGTSNMTLGADLTNPSTWTLTATRNVTAPGNVFWTAIDAAGNYTSMRLLIQVGPSHFIASTYYAAAPKAVYVGAIDSVMNSTDDPMPLFIAFSDAAASVGNAQNSSATMQGASPTRMPKQTPGAAMNTQVYQYAYGSQHAASQSTWAAGGLYANTTSAAGGTIGDPSNTSWSLFLSGVLLSPIGLVTSGNNGVASLRGGMRGTLKGVVACYLAAHTTGDTFTAGGVTYAACGVASAQVGYALDTSL